MSHRHEVTIALCKAVNASGVWSDQAVAGLVGQSARLQGTGPHGLTEFDITVEAAYIEDGDVKIKAHFPCAVDRITPIAADWWNADTVGHYVAPPGEPS